MLTSSHLQIALQIAALAVVFCDLLTREKMILDWYGRWVDRVEAKRPKVARLLGYCSKCTAGQLATLIFAIRYVFGWEANSLAFVRAVCFVSITILLAQALSLALSRLER